MFAGTSSGFGLRFVNSVLQRGDRVIATARNLQSIAHFRPSDNLRTMELDISADEATIRRKAEEALNFWGRIDVLLNNAGYSLKILAEDAAYVYSHMFLAPSTDTGLSDRLLDFQTQFQTNFYGPAILTNAILPQMRKRREGTIVMIGSRSSWNPLEVIMSHSFLVQASHVKQSLCMS